ncbi:hypothetical protein GGS24DRAFT_443567 [Hypoxylon argillaceum]|nr:hypothetical protein GGS24DRAFT_443567 [Hypoxylon argillaceum]
MAFLHWRAILLEHIHLEEGSAQELMEQGFCRTLCLGQVPQGLTPHQWVRKCYQVFATQLRNRLPQLRLDDALEKYADDHEYAEFNDRQFLQSHFGSGMMGRCFFLTKYRLGMGTGAMLPKDMVVVPLGCRTPIILRKDSKGKKFRFVGDAYLDGNMNGEAIKDVEG